MKRINYMLSALTGIVSLALFYGCGYDVEVEDEFLNAESSGKGEIGGTLIESSEYPEVLRIDMRCSAVTISERHILTAGHCALESETDPSLRTHFQPGRKLMVDRALWNGQKDQINGYWLYKIVQTDVHPDYIKEVTLRKQGQEPGFANYRDLAIVKFDSSFIGRPATISTRSINQGKVTVVAAGCSNDIVHAKSMSKLELNVKKQTGTKFFTEDSPQKTTCPGDSGGGAFQGGSLVGIAVGSQPLSNLFGQVDGYRSYFERLDQKEVLDWIYKIINQ